MATTTVVSPRAQDELKSPTNRLVSTRHLQFMEDHKGREGAERVADAEPTIGTGPVVRAVVMPSGKNGVDVGDVFLPHHLELLSIN